MPLSFHDLQDAARRETVMDVTEEQIARVYAEAAVKSAPDTQSADELVEQLQLLVSEVLNPFPKFERMLGSALLKHEEKVELLDRVLKDRLGDRALRLLKVLSAHGRLGIVRSVVRAARRLHGTRSGREDVELTVASELDDDLLKQFASSLRETLGREPVLQVRVDPSLLAGFIIRVGDTVYDSSVRTRFQHARQAMIRRAIEKIETQPESFLGE